MFADLPAGRIAYDIQGSADAPWLILGHSLATTGDMWGLQIPLFRRHFRLLVPNLRGHGASAALKGPYSLADLADDVVALADRLKIERFSYLGLSIGGMVGQELAIRQGARLNKLLLCATMTGSLDQGGQSAWDARLAKVAAEGPASVAEETLMRWLSAGFRQDRPRATDWIRQMIRSTSIAGYLGCGAAIKGMALDASSLAAIKTPSLVIAGSDDPGAGPAMARKIADAIPGARLHVIAGALHLCNVERPHEFNEVALAFLAG